MKRSRLAIAMTLVVTSLLIAGPAIAGTAQIGIDSVGGKKVVHGKVAGTLSGKTLVEGTAIPSSAAPEPAPTKPLVADAGDSAFVGAGSPVTLLGSGYGGSEPYAFTWRASAGTITGADSPTAQLDTTGLAAGTYTATLTITDGSGATATDDVRLVVYEADARTLLDEERTALTPGVISIGAPGTESFPFTVPANTASINVRVDWAIAANDFDLRILDPQGIEANSSAGGAPQTSEEAAVAFPQAGTWAAAIDKFATVPDFLHVVVTAAVGPSDPRPVVDAGGPYRFALGATQALAGSVSGGAAPVSVGWDTDEDGRIDVTGASFTGSFSEGRHIVTLKATDASGLERRETTSVLVASAERLAAETTALTVLAIDDTGVNPYHIEYSAQTYPDPDVLRLTNDFTKHPSEYIPGYPKDAQAIPATLGKGYFPVEDARGPDGDGDGVPDGSIWDLKSATAPWGLEYGKLYWIPGTKIVGAIQPGDFSCSNCEAGSHVILDDDGHGSGSTSVSVGNRYGYCPSCVLVIAKGLGDATTVTNAYPWVDIQSNSWGTVANAPLDLGFQLIGLDPGAAQRVAVERGQTVLFASGNGTANAFDTTSPVYGTSTAGPDWNVVVGAIRRDNDRAIVGDGTPAHLSSWGDGNLPSACRTGTVSQCAFGGTSAATPYTAGVFGTVLTEIRRRIGDGSVGQRPGQVVAEGFAVSGSPYLEDGKLTRAELREAVLKTAFPLNQDNAQEIPIFPYPWTAPYVGDVNVLFEGYGAATPNSAKRAIDVLMGAMAIPVRDAEDSFFEIDRQVRDSLWGGYDRDGDGTTDAAAPLGAFGLGVTDVASAQATWLSLAKVAATLSVPSLTQANGSNALTYWLHRSSESAPQLGTSCADPETYMDQTDAQGDVEPCFENRATTVLAAYRPVGIWPTKTDTDLALPAGSHVTAEIYLTSDQATVVRPTGVLMAGDRVLGEGAGTPTPVIGSGPWVSQEGETIDANECAALGEACWTRLTVAFDTTRPAIAGEQLTFQVQLMGVRAWAFGYEGQHRSSVSITPADLPGSDLDFDVTIGEPAENANIHADTASSASGFVRFPALGTTESGDHPAAKRVDVSVDDPTFASYVEATLTLNADGTQGSWSAPLGGLSSGAHTIYARAQMGDIKSDVAQRLVTVEDSAPRVQWQVTSAGASPAADAWAPANGLLFWSAEFDTRTYGSGDFTIWARIVEDGAQTAITSVGARFR